MVGHAARELLLHARRLVLPRTGRSVMMFPSASGSGSASDLRAFAVAGEMAAHGWRCLCVPPQLSLMQRRRLVALEDPDVLYFQQTRHVLNDPRLFPGRRSVLDVDDADILDERCRTEVVARAAAADAITAGSRFLAELFQAHNAHVRTLWTGTYLRPDAAGVRERRRSIVWAPSGAFGYPQEFEFVLGTIERLAAQRRDFDLHIYGVEAARLREFDAMVERLRQQQVQVTPHAPMAYRDFVSSLRSHSIGLQPISMANPFSRGKSFGKVLAYLVAGVAVIATDELDHGAFFSNGVDGILLAHDVDLWAQACARLLDDDLLRSCIALRGQQSLSEQLTTRAFAASLARVLTEVSDRQRQRATRG